ncbi:hypothetical protein HHL21_18195 [Massilia sp. RP-1-19]|uniref:Zinc-finger domain-containing protein n=1 Tax=Massilia polaris TaxID=2728846 RepID=A0A848HP85_9BURK|nr:hypothetical protein [Massilia polaris]NML62974.1 hypothetical protein [Massilia polaris]
MNAHDAKPDPVSHERAQQLLPWFPSSVLDDAEFAGVEAHVAACAECQADVAWQARLRASAPSPDEAPDADRAFARLVPRLGPQPRHMSVPERWHRAVAANSAWLRWTAAAQFAVIGVLAALLARPGADIGDYRALGSARPEQGDLVLVFRPDTPEHEMRRILQASGARVVDGPGETGAWVLAVPAGQAGGALRRIRAEPSVTLAQPLAAGGQR